MPPPAPAMGGDWASNHHRTSRFRFNGTVLVRGIGSLQPRERCQLSHLIPMILWKQTAGNEYPEAGNTAQTRHRSSNIETRRTNTPHLGIVFAKSCQRVFAMRYRALLRKNGVWAFRRYQISFAKTIISRETRRWWFSLNFSENYICNLMCSTLKFRRKILITFLKNACW